MSTTNPSSTNAGTEPVAIAGPGPMTQRTAPTRRLKQAIWLYIFLLIFEGALRRWVLPGAASPLLVVRDPVALFIIVEAARWRLTPRRPAFWMSYLIAGVGFVLAVSVGHGDGAVALYGARPLVLHFPAMFIIGVVLDRDDLLRVGRFLLAVSIGMAALLALQFYAPQTAFLNRGVGGVGGAGFPGAAGYFRPPGTFSFTNGVALFYGLTLAYVIYFWFVPRHVNRLLLLAATAATLIAIPLSISRSLFFQVLVSLAFAAVAAARKPRLLVGALRAAVATSVAAYVAFRFEAVRTAVDVLLTRFEQAGRSEGGLKGTLVDRYLSGDLVSPIVHAADVPIPGFGLGMGTNVGSRLLTGEAQFLIAEGEWGRVIGELGAVLGLTLIAVRVSVTAGAAVRSWRHLGLGDVLPWMLLSNAILLVPQGSWNQPTSLGFVVVGGGLLLASAPSTRPRANQRGGPVMLVAHPTGNANARSAALALDEAGLLAEFWTCVNWRDDSSVGRMLPERIRRQLRRRSFSEIPAAKVHTAPLRELGRNLAGAAGWGWPTRHETGPFSIDAVYHSLDRSVARRLHETRGLRGVYVPEDGALASLEAARELGIAGVYELPIGYWRAAHEIYLEERERRPEWAATLTGALDSQEKLARKDEELRLASRIVVPSSFVRRTLELAPSLGGPVDLAPYGGPPAIEQLPDVTSNRPLRLLFVGQLSQRKGISDLFDAVAPVGDAVALTVVGRKTSQGCRPLDAALSRHRWISSLPHDELLEEMGRHDVLVFPSLFEGFALVILEAMSRGLTVIATPNTGASDVITDGDNGFIVPIRDPAAIQERIEWLLDDRDRLRSMQQVALLTARRHTWARHRALICEVVRDALADQQSSGASKAQP